ncbi:MAG: hypothetical protein WC966_04720 [Bradymonadales bacterium]
MTTIALSPLLVAMGYGILIGLILLKIGKEYIKLRSSTFMLLVILATLCYTELLLYFAFSSHLIKFELILPL